MYSATIAFCHGRIQSALGIANWFENRRKSSFRGCIVVARIGYIFLWDGGEVDDGIGDGVGASEGKDDARVGGRVGNDNVAT